MTDTLCTYPERDALLVSCLYDDIDPVERMPFDSHLSACRHCQHDLAELRGVRARLGTWAPPEPVRVFSSLQSPVSSPQSIEPRAPSPEPRAWWREIPAWAQVAAALLALGVSATIANLDIRYDRSGLTIRTGWSKRQPEMAVAPANAAPWRTELASLASQLRSEMKTSQATVTAASVQAAPPAISEAEFDRRVRVMLDESERKQQNELALRLVQFQRDITALRQADLTKINQNLGYIQRDTYGELLKQREGMNYLLKVSQKQ